MEEMKSNRSVPQPAVIPELVYPDVRRAVAFLIDAFGFAERLRIGEDHRSQLTFGDGALIVADATHGRQAPQDGDRGSQSVMVRVEDARAHCDHARSHGARILAEPTDFPYGERQYTAEDPFGHRWTFTESIADVDPADWGGTLVSP